MEATFEAPLKYNPINFVGFYLFAKYGLGQSSNISLIVIIIVIVIVMLIVAGTRISGGFPADLGVPPLEKQEPDRGKSPEVPDSQFSAPA